MSNTSELRAAMKAARNDGKKKTYAEWADEFHVTVNVVWLLVSRESLRDAVVLERRGRKPYEIPNRNARGEEYIKTEYRIGKSSLAKADLIGKKLRQVIEGGRIIIEADASG